MIPVHLKKVKDNFVGIFVESCADKRMEIGVCISTNYRDIEKWMSRNAENADFYGSLGSCGLTGLLEIKRVMPSVVAWVRSIGFIPIADPADRKRLNVFRESMSKMGIELY